MKQLKKKQVMKEFHDSKEMYEFTKLMVENDNWVEENLTTFSLKNLEKDTYTSEQLFEGIDINGVKVSVYAEEKEDLDSLSKSGGLLMRMGNIAFPVNEYTALTTIKERAENKSAIQRRFSIEKTCKHLNQSWKELYNKKGLPLQGLALIRGGQLLAVHSDSYSVIPQSEILKKTEDYLMNSHEKYMKENYPTKSYTSKVRFIKGVYSHNRTYCIWAIDDIDSDFMETYKTSWINSGGSRKAIDEYMPVIMLATNDVGTMQITLYPYLYDSHTYQLLGMPIQVKHRGRNSINELEDKLPMLYQSMSDNVEKLSDMIETEINYPIQTLVGAIKEVGLNKITKLGSKEIIEDAKDYFKGTASAYDIYCSISDIFNTKAGQRLNDYIKEKAEIDIIRLVSVDFKKFDKESGRTEL